MQAESMSVGVTSFDNDHKQLIAAINIILSSPNQSMDTIGNVSLQKNTNEYFNSSENLLLKVDTRLFNALYRVPFC